MMKQELKIKQVSELRDMYLEELKMYKADVFRASREASTELDREAYVNQLERVNTILNEREVEERLEREDQEFKKLHDEIQDIIDDAAKHSVFFSVPGFQSYCENNTSQDTNTGTGSKLVVATAERPNIEEC